MVRCEQCFQFDGSYSVCYILRIQYTLRKKCPYSELFWSLFSRIRIEYGIWESPDQNNSEYGHFSRSDSVSFQFWAYLLLLDVLCKLVN